MRAAFWLTALVGVLLLLGGWLGFDAPLVSNVSGEVVDDWYRSQSIWGVLIGAGVGIGFGTSSHRGVRHRPKEDAGRFLDRVGARGLKITFLAAGITVVVSVARAAVYVQLPLAALDRVSLLFWAGKFNLVLGGTIVACCLGYSLLTRVRVWGGQYALLGGNWIPAV